MKEIVSFLQLNEFKTYIVSGTDTFFIRALACEKLNINPEYVVGTKITLNYDEERNAIRGDKLLYKNVKEVKPLSIIEEIGKQPVLSFGNSSGDIAMHRYCLDDNPYNAKAFMVVADDMDRERGYPPEEIEKRVQNWDDFYLFSMKNEWKTIYGDNVTLKKLYS